MNTIFSQLHTSNIPVLDISKCSKARSYGNLIDFIQPDNMTHPLMQGVDELGRPFLSIRIVCCRWPERDPFANAGTWWTIPTHKTFACTIYQHNSSKEFPLVTWCNPEYDMLFVNNNRLDAEYLQEILTRINILLDGGFVKSYHIGGLLNCSCKEEAKRMRIEGNGEYKLFIPEYVTRNDCECVELPKERTGCAFSR